MGELERLNQSLLFQIGKLALSCERRGVRQLTEYLLKILEPLLPAHIFVL